MRRPAARPPGPSRHRSFRGPCPAGTGSSRAPRCRASSASRAAARPGPPWSGAPIRPRAPRSSEPSRSPSGVFSPLRCRAGPGIAGLASAGQRGLRGARLDGARVGHRRVTLVVMHAPGQVERVWARRLRWRMRGAWQWPAFGALTLLDAILLTQLPFYDDGPGTIVAGVLVAMFFNLLAVAVV